MTVEKDLAREQYATNATTGPWTVRFYFLADVDLAVTYTDASGSSLTLTLDVDYAITGAGDEDGGTVTTTTAYAAGGYITILRAIALLQESEYVDGDSLPAATLERNLDRLTMITQQLAETQGRTLQFPPTDTDIGTLPSAVERANLALTFDGDGNPVATLPIATAAVGFTPERHVAVDGQTVFILTSTTYSPGGNNIAAFVDGLLLASVDFSETSPTSVTLAQPLSAGQELTLIAGRLVNFSDQASRLPGDGTVLRTAAARAIDSRSINEYAGADPTGTTDSSVAVAAYGSYLQVEYFPIDAGGREELVIDAGIYEISAQTYNRFQRVRGKGRKSSFLRLKPGETAPMFTFNAENIAGTSIDDANHCSVRELTLVGNRTDSTTTSAAGAIYCPDAPFALGTQYAPSVEIVDVEFFNFMGDNIHLGVNRNWPLIERVISRYSNSSALVMYGYDGRISSSDFGVCGQGNGVNLVAGGSNVFMGCNIYGNLVNIVIQQFVNSPNSFHGCAVDNAFQYGLVIGPGAAPTTLHGGRFTGNGASADNTYADISVKSDLSVFGTTFVVGGTNLPRLTMETDGTQPKILWLPTYVDMSGGAATPFRGFLTDDFTTLRFSGASDEHMGSAGASTLSAYVAAAEVARFDSTGLNTFNAAQVLRTLVTLTNYAAAGAGTLTNAPVAGNPTKWIAINDNGTIRRIPTW